MIKSQINKKSLQKMTNNQENFKIKYQNQNYLYKICNNKFKQIKQK